MARALSSKELQSDPAAELDQSPAGSDRLREKRWWIRGHFTLRAGLFLVTGLAQPAASLFGQVGHWSFEEERVIAGDGLLRVPADIAAGRDRVVVADVGAGQVLCIGLDGTVLWTFGEPGSDPGQFERVAAVDVAATGDVVALDTRRQRVVTISSEGDLLQEPHLPFAFGRIDDIVGLADGRLAITGRTRWEGRGAHASGVHLFASDLTHISSFGPVPRVETERLQLSWGVGSLRDAPTLPGLILGLKKPYEIVIFSYDGHPRRTISVQLEEKYSVDDVWDFVETDDGRVSMRETGLPVHIPSGAAPIVGDAFLSQRSILGGNARFWDVIDASGEIVQSYRIPSHWLYPSDISEDGSRIYVIGEDAGGPAIIVVEVVYEPGAPGGSFQ